MSIWLIASIATGAAAAILLVPFWWRRRRAQDAARLDYDLAVYRRQLADVEADHADGRLDDEAAAEARLEIERQILAAAERKTATTPASSLRWPAAGAVALVLAGALALYGTLGAPSLPSKLPAPRPAPAVSGEMNVLAARLAGKLEKDPDNHGGWLLLARTYDELRRHAEAAAAYSRALALKPDDAVTLSRYGESLVLASEGQVSKPARAAFEEALRRDPKLAPARYYLALHDYQNARGQAAYAQWLQLAKDLKPASPGRRVVVAALAQVARELGIELSAELKGEAPAPRAPAPGPSAADVAAAGEMSGKDRAQFIESMVGRLAERLKSEPDDLAGWRRLARAYGVLKRWDKAAEAYGQIARLEPDDVDARRQQARMALKTAARKDDVPATAQLAFAEVLRLAPDDGEALWYAGLGAVNAGRYEEGLAHWRRLLASIPEGRKEHTTLKDEIERAEKHLAGTSKN